MQQNNSALDVSAVGGVTTLPVISVVSYQPETEADAATARLQQQLQRIRSLVLQEEAWRQLKVDAKFEVQDTVEAYFIRAPLPGFTQEDVSVELSPTGGGQRQLKITGASVPSAKEMQSMFVDFVKVLL